MVTNLEVKIQMTERMATAVRAAAVSRAMTLGAFVNMVVRDFLLRAAALAGGRHDHCFCQLETVAGLGRCCWCEQWGQPVQVRPGAVVRSLTRVG